MSTKHTPGPWLVRHLHGRNEFGVFWVDRTLTGRREFRVDNRCGEFKEADAHLISAAPDLLAALEEARAGLAWYQAMFPETASGSDDEAMERIDAAIAKATGEQA